MAWRSLWLTLCCVAFIGCIYLFVGKSLPLGSMEIRAADLMADYRRPITVPTPAGAIKSLAEIGLGQALFNDPRFSRSGRTSCATCHVAELAWGDGKPRARGDGGALLPRRSPTLLNLAWGSTMGWAGQFKDIESVTFGAITGPANMGSSTADVITTVSNDPAYAAAFATIFPSSGVTQATFEAAIAAYERTLVSGETPFDRWIEGDERAIGETVKRGFALFNGKAGCSGCHSGWNFTDGSYHDIGTATGSDLGRGSLFPTVTRLQYAFKVPTLREIGRRAPYMHDGSLLTLAAVIDLYDRGGIDRPSRSTEIRPLGLTAPERAELQAFLETLDSMQ